MRIFTILSMMFLLSTGCGEKKKSTPDEAKNKDQVAKKAGPDKKAPGKVEWKDITIPDAILEKVTHAGGQTNALFEGQQARMSVSCKKDKEIACTVKSGALKPEIQAELVKAVGEKLIETHKNGIGILCSKKSDKWTCQYNVN
ncbi:hypothetical protein KKF34_08550 [Myxococcota bacterium]|nr:hypothetical protein [Myxococcota bacterium]MBU1381636.1 hypothetical protein [Myxococcota bacterium]MBU1496913.1 hypothetical protein [Myxococcota bacterium]